MLNLGKFPITYGMFVIMSWCSQINKEYMQVRWNDQIQNKCMEILTIWDKKITGEIMLRHILKLPVQPTNCELGSKVMD